MTNNSTAPPPPRPQPSVPTFSSVPDEFVVSCLARISKSHYRSLSSVSKSFHSLLFSPEIYAARSQIGATEPRLYLCLRLRLCKTTRHCWFTLRNPDQILNSIRGEVQVVSKRELVLVPVKPPSSSYACVRREAAIVAVGSEIYQIGGSYGDDKRSGAVRVLDCRSQTRRLAPNMRVARKSAKACFLDGKIYVTGGCTERDEPMNWGEVFDLNTQTWNEEPLPSPSGDKFGPSYKLVVFGPRLYVITKRNKYAYDPKQGRWLLEMGLVGLKPIRTTSTPWCVIENLVFTEDSLKLWWYDLSCGVTWSLVEGLTDLYIMHDWYHHRPSQLVNYDGKLVLVWLRQSGPPQLPHGFTEERTWFAVIKLEKRITSSGPVIRGEMERLNSLVPGSYTALTCLSVSL